MEMIKFLKSVIQHFFDSNTFQKGAALAYYTVFSLLPMIVVVVSLLGVFFGRYAVSGEIYAQLKGVLGNEGALQIQEVVKNQHINHNNVLTSVLGFVMLMLSASGMFSQIHSSFNDIWGVEPEPGKGVLNYVKKNVVSFLTLLVLFAIIFLSTALNSLLLKYSASLNSHYALAYLYEHVITLAALCLVFAIMFKFLSDSKVKWRVSLSAGLFTSVLFMIGKTAIGMYISHSHLSTTFGAMSTIALLMMWVYYTSQIIFLGASFLKVLNDRRVS